MTEAVITALVTSGLALLGVVIRQLSNFRRNDIAAHDRLHEQMTAAEGRNNAAHTEVASSVNGLRADLHEHRVVTEAKLDGIIKDASELKQRHIDNEKYWRDRGETITERLARLEAERQAL